MEKYTIGIRTDANNVIAMGHLVRCMSIAKQLKNMGQNVKFIISERFSEKYIEENGFESICLNNKYDDKDSEIEELVRILKEENISKLLIDSYEVTMFYMEELKKNTKIIYIDDINSFKYPADIIINYADSASMSRYEGRGYKDEKFLFGSRYIPLRPEFGGESIVINGNINSVFITTGGTDSYNMIIDIIKRMQECGYLDIDVHVVVGKFYEKLDELKNLSKENNHIIIYYNISDICSVMKKCDIAISAGGTTMLELCACGIPTICFTIADNQLPATNAFADKEIIRYVGDIRVNKDEVLDKIIKDMLMMKNNYNIRKDLSDKAKSVIDGHGAQRIAKCIVEM